MKFLSFVLRGCAVFSIIGLLALWILELNNPYFADSVKLASAYFVMVPAVFGCLFGLLVFSALRKRDLVFSDTVYILYPAAAVVLSLTCLCVLAYLGLPVAVYLGIPLVLLVFSVLVRRGMINFIGKSAMRVSRLSGPAKFTVAAMLLLLMTGAVTARFFSVRDNDTNHKILLLGFDGASWNVIEPLIAEGELPNLKTILDNGSSGRLRSLDSMFSPQIWASIASGKTPAKHGIYDFLGDAEDMLVKRVWEILEENGWSIGIFGYFSTYPPREVDGFMVPGFFSPGLDTYPSKYSFIRKLYFGSLNFAQTGRQTKVFKAREKSIKSVNFKSAVADYGLHAVRYGLRLSTIDYGRRAVWTGLTSKRNTILKLRMSFSMLIAKVKFTSDMYSYMTMGGTPDFSIYYNKIPDNISHLFWRFYEPENFDISDREMAEFKDSIQEVYREMDRTTGKILKNISENTTVLFVSDHGFQARWPDSEKRLSGQVVLEKLGLENKARMWNVNYSLEVVVNYPEDEKYVRNRLRSLKLRNTGENILKIREPRGWSDPLNFILDVNDVIDLAELREREVIVDGDTCLLSDFFLKLPRFYSGIHRIDGVIAASGKGIKKNYEIGSASVLDVTPTILSLAGLPVPKDMDGSVIEEMLTPEFRNRFPVSHIDTYETEDRRRRRWSGKQLGEEQCAELQALGYIQ